MGVAPLVAGSARPSAERAVVLVYEYLRERGFTMEDGFRMLDRNGDGWVAWDEFYWGIKQCAQDTWMADITDDELRTLFQRFDQDGDQLVSVAEFCGHYALFCELPEVQPAAPLGAPVPDTPTRRRQSLQLAEDVITRIAGALIRMGCTAHDLFNKVDLDANGDLSVQEVERVVRNFQPDLTADEFAWIWRKFDADNSGTVSSYEFCKALDESHPALPSVSIEAKVELVGHRIKQMGYSVHQAFALFDRNNDGYLTREEWSRVLEFLVNQQLTPDDIEAMFRRFDTSQDGLLDVAEFERFFLSATLPGSACGTPCGTPCGGSRPTTFFPSTPLGSERPTILLPADLPVSEPATVLLPSVPQTPKAIDLNWAPAVIATVKSCLSYARSGFTLDEAFRRLDITGSNTMTRYEFQRMISAYEPQLTQMQLDQLFALVNISGSGEITFDEFRQSFG